MTDPTAQTLRLGDGRLLGFAEYGDLGGTPLVYFHGTPGSRLELGLPGIDAALGARGIRAIALDRPGIGLSTPKPRRRILDWPNDVARAADALGLERFMVLGASGGCPYTLACAQRLPGRLTAVGVAVGIAPIDAGACWDDMTPRNRKLFRVGRWFAAGLKPLVGAMERLIARAPDRAVEGLLDRLPEADRAILGEGPVREAMIRSWREAFRQGPGGPWWELVLESRRWGFSLSQVPVPILLWIGGVDRTIPPSMGRYLAAALPRSEARVYPAEGHLSLVVNRHAEMLDLLLQRSRGSRQVDPVPAL
jgi:pimeloyl-ACP methyl ester carboxylesterase